MTIMTRIVRLWKADIHGVMDQMEDRELLLKQYLREMENALQHKENRLRQLAESARQVKKNLGRRTEEIEKLECDLQLALRKENDEIARALIRRQRIEEKCCEQLRMQAEGFHEEEGQLCELLARQRLQYENLKAKAATFCRQTELQRFTEDREVFHEPGDTFSIDEDEIELELLRRKEKLQKGGGVV